MKKTDITAPTPMLSQYLKIKEQHKDCILFFRMGDFYEMFFEDAITAAPLLEVQLTSRDKSAENPIPMCGIPHHAIQNYIKKLLEHGLKVALCEQMEDPAVAKGIVKREVTKILTPALISDPDLVSEDVTQTIGCIDLHKKNFFVVFIELLSGEVHWGEISEMDKLSELFQKYTLKELLLKDKNQLSSHLSSSILMTERPLFFEKKASLEGTFQALKRYLLETQKNSNLEFLKPPKDLFEKNTLFLDSTTVHSLEILRGPLQVSLFSIMDRTLTSMGRRLFKKWLLNPLKDILEINKRLDAVEMLTQTPSLYENLKKELKNIRDLERLSTKTSLGSAGPRDLVGIKDILKKIPTLVEYLKNEKSVLLSEICERLDPLTLLTQELERALLDEAPLSFKDGNLVKESYSERISELRRWTFDAKTLIASMEEKEKKSTNIASLKIRYNRVFGYYIEISKSYLQKVPQNYIRKQTLSNCERFITPELKEIEDKILNAETQLKILEEEIFLHLRNEVTKHTVLLLKNAQALSELDVLLSLATFAMEKGYIKPQMHLGWDLEIIDGRHPIVEQLIGHWAFVPNSIHFDQNKKLMLITGPNMAGKSTVMKQMALIVLLAHMGSFVPAKAVKIPIVDALFTRIGSQDDLLQGQSTFMVEMTEMARILKHATSQSLILIDEIGRGTSTYDGLSLAWAILEYIYENISCKTFFATHYQELTQLESKFEALCNMHVLVDNQKGEIIFLHKLDYGTCHKSYGIEVASLAGLPPKVLSSAKRQLLMLESQSHKAHQARHKALDDLSNQMQLF